MAMYLARPENSLELDHVTVSSSMLTPQMRFCLEAIVEKPAVGHGNRGALRVRSDSIVSCDRLARFCESMGDR